MLEGQPLDGRLFGRDQPCFGCGAEHPIGFRLAFAREGDAVVTRFVPGDQYQGPPGILHGGLAATLADEVAAWTLIGLKGRFGFTTSIQVKLHRAIRIGREVVGSGRIATDNRRIVDVAVALEQDGELALSGTLRFALLDRAAAEKLLGGPIPEDWDRFAR